MFLFYFIVCIIIAVYVFVRLKCFCILLLFTLTQCHYLCIHVLVFNLVVRAYKNVSHRVASFMIWGKSLCMRVGMFWQLLEAWIVMLVRKIWWISFAIFFWPMFFFSTKSRPRFFCKILTEQTDPKCTNFCRN